VSDEEILEAYRMLAREEGVFGEPASAASVAGLLHQARAGVSFAGQTLVCVITGNGLKDPDRALAIQPEKFDLPADAGTIERVLGWA